MWGDLIWAVAFVAVSVIALCLVNKRGKEFLEFHRQGQALKEEIGRVELQERENAVRLETETAEERAEHEKAQLLQKAAGARAASVVAESPTTIDALQKEEVQVIAARAEGRAQSAREQALHEDDDSKIAILMDGYKAALEEGLSTSQSFKTWMGRDIDLKKISVKQLEVLVDGYKAALEEGLSTSQSFGTWMGRNIDLEDFQ